MEERDTIVEQFRGYLFSIMQDGILSLELDDDDRPSTMSMMMSIDVATRVFEQRLIADYHRGLAFSVTYHQWFDGGFSTIHNEHIPPGAADTYLASTKRQVEVAGTRADTTYHEWVETLSTWPSPS